jgi:hypothetical protein
MPVYYVHLPIQHRYGKLQNILKASSPFCVTQIHFTDHICRYKMKHSLEYDGTATSSVLLKFFLLVWVACVKILFYIAPQATVWGCEVQ